ncbi:sensor histidine kinase [Rothia koreensis]|uniref:sensor histidine kinase n=1 Tax=Rothia koreensis TaxID=592378 RepID=UPI0037CB1D94
MNACADDMSEESASATDPRWGDGADLQGTVPRTRGDSWLRRWGRASVYLLGSFPVSLVSFIVVVTLLSAGVGLLPVFLLGVFLLWGAVYYGRGVSWIERSQVAWLRGRPLRRPIPPRPGQGLIDRFKADAGHGQSWMNIAWILVDFVVSTVVFWVVFAWWCVVLAGIAGPITLMIRSGSDNPLNYGSLADLLSWSQTGIPFVSDHPYLTEAFGYMLLALVFLVTLPWLTLGLARIRSELSSAMLCLPESARHRVAALQGSRAAARRAEGDALRRLERDIHDGPQQRLVRLGMDISRAQRFVSTDPEKADRILREAGAQNQETLQELRQLSRGIAPALLVDRGLRAAVSESVVRSGVPVALRCDADENLPSHVEMPAYFLISEALVNVNKHSGASEALVAVRREADRLVVEVRDDGVGGASVAKGHGLAGLEDRLRGVDGELNVESPAGEGTLIRGVIPCE